MQQPSTQEHPFARAKVVIFDIDDTLYHQSPKVIKHAEQAYCKAITKTTIGAHHRMSDKKIVEKGHLGLKQHGDAYHPDTCPSKDPKTAHHVMHKWWRTTGVVGSLSLPSLLGELRSTGVLLFAYSDAHQDWSKRILRKLGIERFFPPERLITRDKLRQFGIKRDSDEGFELIRNVTKFKNGNEKPDYSEMVFVDDNLHNLAKAKALGITTVHINHGKTNPLANAAADFQYRDIAEFLTDFEREIAPRRRCTSVTR